MNLHECSAVRLDAESTRGDNNPSIFPLGRRSHHERDRWLHNYGGQKLHFVQIGLGTNTTFIQNLVGDSTLWSSKVHFLFRQSSLWDQDLHFTRGIAVEPVLSLVEDLQPLASELPHVRLLQAAIGEEAAQDVPIFGLCNGMRADALRQVSLEDLPKLTEELEYFRNMSCLEGAHSLIVDSAQRIEAKYNVKVGIDSLQTVDIWTWGELVEYFNFVGCEVVLIDAEGYDTKILRSLFSYCSDHPEHWPDLIAFETMGHCDKCEGPGAEKAILDKFREGGYTVVSMSDYDSYLIKTTALDKEDRLQWWVNQWFCDECQEKWFMPYMQCYEGVFCKKCFSDRLKNGKLQPLYISRCEADTHV